MASNAPNHAVDPNEMTLDELRLHLAPLLADAAVFDGWNDTALAMAARQAGADVDVARLAYDGNAMDMIAAWIETIDTAMADALPPAAQAQMKIRERIRSLVQFRLDAVAGREEALRRAIAIMAMPQNVASALRTGWHSADVMWRLAGDTATDYNHYTKRATLASIYGATLAVFLDDESDNKAETRAFLDRRIDGVMRFEKTKAKWLHSDRDRFSVTRFLGRLRYPAR
ncbi:RpsU-divergently transcribed [Erythrobacter sp. QSSC1-22B]|uniref:COQ9 family protein n=1 Tax=Erythrobacter sp. QSSC1-22B TaxID=1860125 RepID=UPI0008058EB0|nr:COQ9 family protein [Erythrobacter sp. QSSC1-22B]OBX17802.1 RpsU-divergently transcribed [Erythrobacter sp. QSSC1-22B]